MWVTHGGERIGACLVSALRSLGAVPVMHSDGAHSHTDASFHDAVYYSGPLALAAREAMETIRPDIVLHSVRVEPTGAENEDVRAWHHVVRETEQLARELWTQRPGTRLVVAAHWGGTRPGDEAAAIAAAMETVVLNRAGAESVSVVRLPRVLTAARLTETRAISNARTSARFDALESEAVAALIEIAAGGFRGIYTLAPGPEIDLDDARRALAVSDDAMWAAPRSHPMARAGLVFPSEHLDVCGIDSMRRILSPLFPAADPFRKLAALGPADASRAEREQWMRVLTAQLYRLGDVIEETERDA